ncbi:conjugal transfer protein [Streptomyces phaeochromogenes]|uniref:conjugal transfer protein n=1 Tax=Streptomyces phaeochromogenes TaxID=1923 RepID=UPI002E10637A|nr:conjugal transfer protein [Streptomyces phaeochromogenes]
MPRAKQPRKEQAPPPTAADAWLQQMRRRVHLARLGVWTAVAAGPIALAVTIATPATVVQAAPEEKPTTVKTTLSANPSGYATVFLSAWLRSHAGGESSAQARLAQSMAPDVELPGTADAQPEPESVVAVRSAQQTGTAWSVTVAAQYPDGRLRYFAVPVVVDSSGASFTVTGAPGAVAGPARAEEVPSPYTVAVPTDSDLSATAGESSPHISPGPAKSTATAHPGLSCRLSPPPRTRRSPSSSSSPPTSKRPPSPSPWTEPGRG